MYETPVLSSTDPHLILVEDQRPPLGLRIYMVSKYGVGFLGEYREEFEVVAWSPLPRCSPKDKLRLQQALAKESAVCQNEPQSKSEKP